MSRTPEILRLELGKTIGKLRSDYESSGLRASGSFGRSLKSDISSEVYGYRGIIQGASHTYYMVNGRAPNKNQSRGQIAFMYVKILEWMQVKGLTDLNPWLVARKIVMEGIKVPNQHNQGTLISNVINDVWLSAINREIFKGQNQDLFDNVVKQLKTIQKN